MMIKNFKSICFAISLNFAGCSTQDVQTFGEIMKGMGESAQQAQQNMDAVDNAIRGSQPKTMSCYPQPNGVGTYCVEN